MDGPAATAEPSTGRGGKTSAERDPPRPRRRGPFGVFDALGGLAVAAFVFVAWSNLREFSRPQGELSLHVDPAALAAGFREGVSWHGLYREGDKVGFTRTERRRRADGFSTAHTMVLPLPGVEAHQSVSIVTELDARFVLRGFSASVQGGPLALQAEGTWQAGGLSIAVHGLPGGDQSTVIPMEEPPQLDQSFMPLAGRDDLAPGDRFSFTHFDPLTSSQVKSTVEVVGPESLDVLGEHADVLHLRQQLAGETLDVWVNGLGEVLQQTLPGGLLAVRESEAEATWGVLSPAAGSNRP